MVIFAYFAVIALAFFFLIVRPQRRRIAAHRQLVEALSVGDEVVTTGGIFGTIRDMNDERIDLEVAPGVTIAVARAAIAQSANPAVPPAIEPTPDDPSGNELRTDNGTTDD